MKKILLISRGTPTEKDPMWGNFEFDQALALKSLGYKVIVISIDRRTRLQKRKIGITMIKKMDIPMYGFYFPLPYLFLPRIINNWVVDFFSLFLLKSVLRLEGEIDLIHAHYLPNIRIAVSLKKILNVPVIGTEHWSELKRPRLRRHVYKDALYTYSNVDQLITVSYPLKDIIKNKFNVDSVFVGCVIDEVFKYKEKINRQGFSFIAVGSLLKIKGFDVAIKAFHKSRFDESVVFRIIGSGKEEKSLRRLIMSLGLEKQVILEGRKSRSEIMSIMQASDAYVLSSRSENFATACMEALSVGLPAVMTACGGPESFVNSSNSVIVPVDDVSEMASAMRYIVNNINLYDRKKISNEILSGYSASSIAKQLDIIYKKLFV